jgi:hypothetical protein
LSWSGEGGNPGLTQGARLRFAEAKTIGQP